MKYWLLILMFPLGLKAQVDSYLSTTGTVNLSTCRPMIAINMDFLSSKYIFRSSIVSALDEHNANFFQEKFGMYIKNWSALGGASLHFYPTSYSLPSEWAFVTEIRYTHYIFNRFWGFTLQHDGNFVLFGIEIGGKF
jgi:hypothetical protein